MSMDFYYPGERKETRVDSPSIALREQETPFGTIKYDFDEYKPE